MRLAEGGSRQEKLRRQGDTGLQHRTDAVQGFVGDLVVTCYWAGVAGWSRSRRSKGGGLKSKLCKTSGALRRKLDFEGRTREQQTDRNDWRSAEI